MYTFLGGIALLIIGYFTYGKFVEKVFGSTKSVLRRPSVNAMTVTTYH